MASMQGEFSGKKALVTGAGKGIGRSIVGALHKAGAEVWAVSRTAADLQKLQEAFSGIHTVCVDLSDWDATSEALKSLPVMDFLVNNAGITSIQPFLEETKDNLFKVFSVNAAAVFHVSQIVCKAMVEAGRPGAVVTVSSQSSMLGLVDHTSYCMSKGAVDQLTRVMALELGPKKIRVNNVNPTVVMTEMGRKAWSDPAKSTPMLSRIPLQRFSEESEVADAVCYLLSDKASMIHGHNLVVDGGFTCH